MIRAKELLQTDSSHCDTAKHKKALKTSFVAFGNNNKTSSKGSGNTNIGTNTQLLQYFSDNNFNICIKVASTFCVAKRTLIKFFTHLTY